MDWLHEKLKIWIIENLADNIQWYASNGLILFSGKAVYCHNDSLSDKKVVLSYINVYHEQVIE